MKKQLIILTIAMLAFAALLLGLSCGAPPQNNANSNSNAGRNDNAIAINANTDSASFADDPCTATSDKPGKVKTQITNDVMAKTELKRQYLHHLFKFEVYPGSTSTSLYLYFTGKLGGPDSMGELAAIVKKVAKKSCVEKIFFATDGTLPPNLKATPFDNGEFFEWFVCEDPKVPCVGGECKLPAQCPAPTPDPVANSNSNSKPTANAK